MSNRLRVQSSSMNRHQLEEYRELAKDGHGWVLPRPDGSKANCGGPGVCRICRLEQMVYTTSNRMMVVDGFNLKPGDKLLLIGPPDMIYRSEAELQELRDMLRKNFPEVDITVMVGFTGVQVHRQEPKV